MRQLSLFVGGEFEAKVATKQCDGGHRGFNLHVFNGDVMAPRAAHARIVAVHAAAEPPDGNVFNQNVIRMGGRYFIACCRASPLRTSTETTCLPPALRSALLPFDPSAFASASRAGVIEAAATAAIAVLFRNWRRVNFIINISVFELDYGAGKSMRF